MLQPSLPPSDSSSAAPATAASHGFTAQNTPFDALGGEQAVRGLVDTFYDLMDRDERFARIRSLHQPALEDARQKLFEFLCGWLGGPPRYINKYGHPRLRARHMPFAIGEAERDLWLACMQTALDARGIEGELRSFLDQRFAHVANFMRNVDAGGTGVSPVP